MNIIKLIMSWIMCIYNYFYPKNFFRINYATNTITLCSNKKLNLLSFQKKTLSNNNLVFYHNVYCYDINKYNKIASNLLQFNVYDDVIIYGRCSLKHFEKICRNTQEWNSKTLDSRLYKK